MLRAAPGPAGTMRAVSPSDRQTAAECSDFAAKACAGDELGREARSRCRQVGCSPATPCVADSLLDDGIVVIARPTGVAYPRLRETRGGSLRVRRLGAADIGLGAAHGVVAR